MEHFLTIFIETLLKILLPVVFSALAAFLIAQAKLLWVRAKNQQPDLADTLEWVARTAVYAAEQAGAADLIDDKKDYAIEVAEMWLSAKGLPIDLDMIEAAIEAAVYSEINKERAGTTPLHHVSEL
jgi:hypothetical protein